VTLRTCYGALQIVVLLLLLLLLLPLLKHNLLGRGYVSAFVCMSISRIIQKDFDKVW